QHFADGGIVDYINPVKWLHAFYNKVKGLASGFWNAVSGDTPVGNLIREAPGALIKDAGGAVWGWLKSLPGKLLTYVGQKIAAFFGIKTGVIPMARQDTIDQLIEQVVTGKTFSTGPAGSPIYPTGSANRSAVYNAAFSKHLA